eukprot:m51a1_g10910 hypothetical protein (276) ;mRNA; r:67232-68297
MGAASSASRTAPLTAEDLLNEGSRAFVVRKASFSQPHHNFFSHGKKRLVMRYSGSLWANAAFTLEAAGSASGSGCLCHARVADWKYAPVSESGLSASPATSTTDLAAAAAAVNTRPTTPPLSRRLFSRSGSNVNTVVPAQATPTTAWEFKSRQFNLNIEFHMFSDVECTKPIGQFSVSAQGDVPSVENIVVREVSCKLKRDRSYIRVLPDDAQAPSRWKCPLFDVWLGNKSADSIEIGVDGENPAFLIMAAWICATQLSIKSLTQLVKISHTQQY